MPKRALSKGLLYTTNEAKAGSGLVLLPLHIHVHMAGLTGRPLCSPGLHRLDWRLALSRGEFSVGTPERKTAYLREDCSGVAKRICYPHFSVKWCWRSPSRMESGYAAFGTSSDPPTPQGWAGYVPPECRWKQPFMKMGGFKLAMVIHMVDEDDL